MVDRALLVAGGIGAIGLGAIYFLTRPPAPAAGGGGGGGGGPAPGPAPIPDPYAWPQVPEGYGSYLARCDYVSCSIADKPFPQVRGIAVLFGQWRRATLLHAEIEHNRDLFPLHVSIWVPGSPAHWQDLTTFYEYNPFSDLLVVDHTGLARREFGGILFETPHYELTGIRALQVT